ncbi:MAG: radical SAM protein, partial [Woeseiaceae bacterium]
MTWLDALTGIEDLEDAQFDPALVAEFERRKEAAIARPIRFSTPTFKEYETTELEGCGKNSFPAFSITAGECGLNCDHCQKKILEPMIPATKPAILDAKVRELIENQALSGFLLSGGSNRRNEIPSGRYMPVIERLKLDFPQLKVAVHKALLDAARAREMVSAGVDTVMIDVIGAQDT